MLCMSCPLQLSLATRLAATPIFLCCTLASIHLITHPRVAAIVCRPAGFDCAPAASHALLWQLKVEMAVELLLASALCTLATALAQRMLGAPSGRQAFYDPATQQYRSATGQQCSSTAAQGPSDEQCKGQQQDDVNTSSKVFTEQQEPEPVTTTAVCGPCMRQLEQQPVLERPQSELTVDNASAAGSPNDDARTATAPPQTLQPASAVSATEHVAAQPPVTIDLHQLLADVSDESLRGERPSVLYRSSTCRAVLVSAKVGRSGDEACRRAV